MQKDKMIRWTIFLSLTTFLVLGLQSNGHAQQTKREKEFAKKHKIKSLVTTTYQFKNDSVNKNPNSISKDYFSKNGIKTLTIFFDCLNPLYNATDSLPKSIILYTYDTKGNIKQTSKGSIFTDIYSNNKDTIWKGSTTYKCDSNGNILEKKYYGNDRPDFIIETENSPYIFTTYKYDTKGNIIEELQGSKGNQASWITLPDSPAKADSKYIYKYQYDKKGQIIQMVKEISYNHTEIYEYKYDSIPNIIEEFKQVNRNNSIDSLLTKYSFATDSTGLIKEKYTAISSGHYSSKSKIVYTYEFYEKEK